MYLVGDGSPDDRRSFLKERLLSRCAPRKRSSILGVVPGPGVPNADARQCRVGGQGQAKPPEGSLDAREACWRMLGWAARYRIRVSWGSRPVRGSGHEVSSPVPKRASGGQAADAVAGHSCAVERHGVLRPPTRRGQSDPRSRRRTGDHDLRRPRVWWCPNRVTPPPRRPSSGWCRLGGRNRRG
jgi:hypothetical protein